MPSSLAAHRIQNIEQTKEKLRALAAEGAPPQILDVLRSLRPHLLECIDRKIRPGRILSTLQGEGWPFSRAGFYLAWGRFLTENGYRTGCRTVPSPQPRGAIQLIRHQPEPHTGRGTSKSTTDALDVLARPSVTELLAKHGL